VKKTKGNVLADTTDTVLETNKATKQTHPTTWRPPMLLYLCNSLPERDTKHAMFKI